MNNLNNLTELKKEYLYMLKENIIPFWLKNGLDKKKWRILDGIRQKRKYYREG